MSGFKLKKLPLEVDLETKTVLKALPEAHALLAELKALAATIPNQEILINTLALQEAKDSSAVENIITTHDELYKSELNMSSLGSLQAKEVQNYIAALKKGFQRVSSHRLLTNKTILEIQEELEKNNAGFRKLPGTDLKNASTGEVVYTPPQVHGEILDLMANLEQYINDQALQDVDPLLKMAVIHYQFESIHPFYDGNGRTGRIINILYLVLQELQSLPILYLSNYIIDHKKEYYSSLQQVRDKEDWQNWLLFMINGVKRTAKETIELIQEIKTLMQEFKDLLRGNYKFYSQELLNNLFKHPYTKIEFLEKDLQVSRLTAANYLNKLSKDGVLTKSKLGTSNYYVNHRLFDILINR